ncbi:MAG: hypothetical protein HDT15_11395 [Oscillibacter sp.]|nr:hypothetical protein [Oscillibacter sp.]
MGKLGICRGPKPDISDTLKRGCAGAGQPEIQSGAGGIKSAAKVQQKSRLFSWAFCSSSVAALFSGRFRKVQFQIRRQKSRKAGHKKELSGDFGGPKRMNFFFVFLKRTITENNACLPEKT